MKNKKYILCFVFLLVLLSPAFVKAWIASGSGQGSTGNAVAGSGSWNNRSIGARFTVVDENGDRFKIKLGNKTYTSKSIDYYADVNMATSGYYAHTGKNNSHSNCNGYLCSRKEVQGAFNGVDGGYTFEAWPYQGINDLKLPTNYLYVGKSEQSIGNAVQNFDHHSNQATDLFQRLMGVSLNEIKQSSTSNCEENKKLLQNVYIIAEPVTNEGVGNGFSGTATEFGILWNGNYKYINGAFPSVINTAIIPQSSGNLGHKYFTAVANNFKIPDYTVSYGTWGSYYNKYIQNTRPGVGVSIIHLDGDLLGANDLACYDYSIDAACVNCNVTSTGNKAYIIQDTNDWDAIFASDDSTNKNIKSYYNKGNGVYCREEYTVYFPDNSDIFYVEPGRYFTLNASASALNKVSATATFPNFKPIKVVKKRVCRVNNGNTSALDAFRRKSESTFKGRTGTVSFKYNETYKDSRYNMSDAEELKPYDESNNYTYSINGDTLTMEVTRNYTLPDNYYQYIRKQDGLSMKTKPSSNLNYYINVGISNLPVSFNNYGDSNDKAADVQFAFELPDNDSYSKLNKAYIKDNSYLKSEDSDGNIYKKYKNNKMEAGDQELLNNSACAKMYGINTSGFQSCASHRTENAIGDGSYNCITQNQLSLTGGTTKGYSCIVLINTGDTPPTIDTDPDCKTEADANRLGRDWNPVGKYCCPVGTKYNSTTGKCKPSNTPGDSCDSETAAKNQGRDWNPIGKYCCPVGTKYNSTIGKCEGSGDNNGCNSEAEATEQGRDWNPKTNTCCPLGTIYNPSTGKCDDGGGGNGDNVCRIENGKYYDFNGNEITKDEYDILCPSNVPYYCPESDCPYGCCPSGECAPMPDGTCPGSGGIDVIYRTIDLENPFPGQNAENRETGVNWCSYNIRTQQIDCKYNNQTVKNYITRERGGTVNGGKVYREDHVLYEVTLDTKTINSIRSYNDKNKYDDWDLQCLENGKACISDFLNSEVTTTGKCANVSRSNFYSCDKDV